MRIGGPLFVIMFAFSRTMCRATAIILRTYVCIFAHVS